MLKKIRGSFTKDEFGSIFSEIFITTMKKGEKGKKRLLNFERRLRMIVSKLVNQGFDWQSYLSPISNGDKVLILGQPHDKPLLKQINNQLKQNNNIQLWTHNKILLPKKFTTGEIKFDWVVVGPNLCTSWLRHEENFLHLKQMEVKNLLLRCKLENNDFYEQFHPQKDLGFSKEKWREWLSARGELMSSVNCPCLQELHCELSFNEKISFSRNKKNVEKT